MQSIKIHMRGHSDNFFSDFKGKNENSPCPFCALIIPQKLNFCAFQLKFSYQIINKTPLSALLKAFMYLSPLFAFLDLIIINIFKFVFIGFI